jgi:cyclic pyranopterin monophosphate synthase
MSEKKFSHTDNEGKAHMVDVGNKPNQIRTATAEGDILLAAETIELIRQNQMKKGDVLTMAEFAGITAAKKTSELIPLCHPLLITQVKVKAQLTENGVHVESFVKCVGQTGIEMEALTAVQVALLTVYDMCKAVDKNMIISNVQLVEKTKE